MADLNGRYSESESHGEPTRYDGEHLAPSCRLHIHSMERPIAMGFGLHVKEFGRRHSNYNNVIAAEPVADYLTTTDYCHSHIN